MLTSEDLHFVPDPTVKLRQEKVTLTPTNDQQHIQQVCQCGSKNPRPLQFHQTGLFHHIALSFVVGVQKFQLNLFPLINRTEFPPQYTYEFLPPPHSSMHSNSPLYQICQIGNNDAHPFLFHQRQPFGLIGRSCVYSLFLSSKVLPSKQTLDVFLYRVHIPDREPRLHGVLAPPCRKGAPLFHEQF